MREAFVREMREGVLLGETVQDLVRRIRGRREHGFKDGLISYSSKASREAQALARTSIMAVANAARFEMYQQNSRVIKGVEWKSTLDTKTTDICKSLDGEAWTLDGKRLPGTTHKWRGPPPAHWGCRSMLSPVLKPWSDLIANKDVRDKVLRLEKQGKLGKGWRAAMDGKVSRELNYGDWLRKQPEAVQIEALGVKKQGLHFDPGRTLTRIVFFVVIPTAASAFYLRLLSGLTQAFRDKERRDKLMAAKTPDELWKVLLRLTRTTVR